MFDACWRHGDDGGRGLRKGIRGGREDGEKEEEGEGRGGGAKPEREERKHSAPISERSVKESGACRRGMCAREDVCIGSEVCTGEYAHMHVCVESKVLAQYVLAQYVFFFFFIQRNFVS
jgi:hypothetical protein